MFRGETTHIIIIAAPSPANGNRNHLGQFRETPWNQTMDVHRGSTLIMRAHGNMRLTLYYVMLKLYNVTMTSQKLC